MRHIADMVQDKNPVTLPQSASVHEACCQMCARRVGAVLIADADRRLVGIFTGRDAVARVLAEGRDPRTTPLASVMTSSPVTLTPDQSAIDALRVMQDGGFRHLPVVKDGRIVSVISRGDFRGLEVARLNEETDLWERI